MATKTFCDACGGDCAELGRNGFAYLCHLDSNKIGYVDRNLNPVSGRHINVDLCNACYNTVMEPSVMKLKELQRKHECQKSTP